MKFQTTKTNQLKSASYNPKIRTEKNALKSLCKSIKEHGILCPLLITPKMEVIDGHRRLAVARLLKIATIPTVITATKINKDEAYEAINTTGKKMGPNEMIFVYINGGTVPLNSKKKIIRLGNILGEANLKKLGNSYISIAILSQGDKVGRYCKDTSDEFIKAFILWVIKHKMTYQVRRAMEDGMSYTTLKNNILSDKPLTKIWK